MPVNPLYISLSFLCAVSSGAPLCCSSAQPHLLCDELPSPPQISPTSPLVLRMVSNLTTRDPTEDRPERLWTSPFHVLVRKDGIRGKGAYLGDGHYLTISSRSLWGCNLITRHNNVIISTALPEEHFGMLVTMMPTFKDLYLLVAIAVTLITNELHTAVWWLGVSKEMC